MNWKNLNQLPKEMFNEDVLMRIVPRDGRPDIIVMGCVDDDWGVYTDTQYSSEIGGFLSRDFYRTIYYIDPKEIKL